MDDHSVCQSKETILIILAIIFLKVDTKSSKALSWLLRHGAEKEGLVIHPGGWVRLDYVLRKPKFKQVKTSLCNGASKVIIFFQ